MDQIPSGKYLHISDINGVEYWLERPVGASLLVFDGTNAYWGDGTAERQIPLNPNETDDNFDGVLGLIGQRLFSIVNDSATVKMLTCVNGVWSLVDANIAGLPQTGFGVAAKVDAVTDPEYLSGANSIIVFNGDGEPLVLGPGSNGDTLQMVGGAPIWAAPNAGAVASGIASIGLEGVLAQSIGTSQVNVKAPTFTVSDGATDLVITNLNVTVDLTNPVGLLGLDTGGEATSKWYWIYAITDGVTPSAIISEDATAPDLTGAPGYTHWGLIGVFRNDAGGNIIEFVQKGRNFDTVPVTWGNNINSTTALAPITSGTSITTLIPPGTKSVHGNVGGSSTATVVRSMAIASTASGSGKMFIGSRENASGMESFKYDAGSFRDMPIMDPAAPVLYWRSNLNSAQRRIEITGYKL